MPKLSKLRFFGLCILLLSAALIALQLSLSTRAGHINRANFDRITVGMTKADVEAILGKKADMYIEACGLHPPDSSFAVYQTGFGLWNGAAIGIVVCYDWGDALLASNPSRFEAREIPGIQRVAGKELRVLHDGLSRMQRVQNEIRRWW